MRDFVVKLKRDKSVWAKIIVLVALYFGANIYFAYATDTYWPLMAGFKAPASDMVLRNGRPVIGLIYALFSMSGLPNRTFYYISTVLALAFLALAIWIYQKILEKHGVSENTRIIVSFACIANIFIIEYFMFIEKCGFMLAVLFNVIAVYFIEKFFEKKRPQYMIASVIAVALAIFTYQGSIALFVVLSLPFVFQYAKSFGNYVVNLVCIGVSYAVPVLVDLLAFRYVFKSARVSGEIDWIGNLKNVISGLRNVKTSTFDILPNNLFFILLLLVFAAAIILSIMHKHKAICALNVVAIAVASAVCSTASILQGSGWWAVRAVYPMASVIGVIVVHLLISSQDLSEKKKGVKMLRGISIALVGVLMIGQYLSFNKIYIDKYRLNTLDEYRYRYVGQAISDYQEATGTEVTKISFYTDASRATPTYLNLYSTGDLVASAFYTDWSDLTALNYYLGTSYLKADPEEKYVEYFASKDWDQLSQEQLIFDGDTLHLCVY